MSTRSEEDANQMFGGLAKLFQRLFGCLDGIAIRCALELHIADIINSHDGPITLSQIASEINSPTLNNDGLSRLMTFLVHIHMFDQVRLLESEEPAYILNKSSSWLLHDSKTTIVQLVMLVTDSHIFSQFFNLDKCILEGGTSMMKTFGFELWDFLSKNPQSNKLFNDAMACRTRISMDAVMSNYSFDGLKGTIIDVGGGVGAAINEIVTAYPDIKGINFDLPHVISTAPTYKGVTHVEGDMFKAISPADAIFLKSILHDWSDEECVRILKNCQNAISQRNGKVIIVDIVLHPGRDDMFDYARMAHDLVMLSLFKSGKERSELEWKKILHKAGFSRYNVIQIPALESIIEAYLD